MNILGIEIRLARNNQNGKYVEKEDCQKLQQVINNSIAQLKGHFDTRFDDMHQRLCDTNKRISDLKDVVLSK